MIKIIFKQINLYVHHHLNSSVSHWEVIENFLYTYHNFAECQNFAISCEVYWKNVLVSWTISQ